MLPFPIVKFLGGGHEFPLHADLVVLAGAAALVKLYLHHFGEGATVLVVRRRRVFGLGERVKWKIVGVDLLYAIGDDVVEGLY